MRSGSAKHDREGMTRRELRRDKEFRAALIRAYGVEKPPRSYHRTLQKTFDSLPEELIYKPRPLRSFARGLAAAAVALVLLCAALLWFNAAQPQVAELLPGLGGFFAELNDRLGRERPEASPVPESSLPESAASREPEDGGFTKHPQDNGVVLEEFTLADDAGCCVVLEVPYLGRLSETLVMYGANRRLGTYGSLSLKNGEEFFLGYAYTDSESEMLYSVEPLETGPFHAVWDIDMGLWKGYLRGSDEWVFTLYEEGESDRDPEFQGAAYGVFDRRVVAEFTLRRDGLAKVSEEYKKKGLKKVTAEELRTEDRAPSFTDGWLSAGVQLVSLAAWGGIDPDYYDLYFKVTAFSAETDAEAVLNCYLDGELRAQVSNYHWFEKETAGMGGEYVRSDSFLNEYIGSSPWYGLDTVFWANAYPDPSLTGRKCQRVIFALPTPLFGVESGDDAAEDVLERIRFELCDPEGNVIFYDMNESCQNSILEMYRRWDARCQPEQALPEFGEASSSEVISSLHDKENSFTLGDAEE